MALPEPQRTAVNAPFWEGVAAGRLVLPRCKDCGAVSYFPRVVCQRCMGTELAWTPMSGRGTVYSFTVTRVAPPGVKAETPYLVATIELEEGARMLTNLVGCDADAPHIGMPVRLVCRNGLPLFEPDRG